jgi:hypothetical protein
MISVSIEPNSTVVDTISLKIGNASPGKYNMTLVARAGTVYSQSKILVIVKTLVEYTPSILVDPEYPYGSNVSIILTVQSGSNGILNGLVRYSLERNGTLVDSWDRVVYIMPGENWSETIFLNRPKPSTYEVRLWSNFGGKYKQVVRNFVVYKRWLGYSVYFRDGAIHVEVHDRKGNGVAGIPVMVDNKTLLTGFDGFVAYPVDEPGIYEIVMNLDGEIVRTYVEVKKLFLTYMQKNDTLEVNVQDSFGSPVPNVTVVALGPRGRDYSLTNSSGFATVSLGKVGYGTILIKAEHPEYLGDRLRY